MSPLPSHASTAKLGRQLGTSRRDSIPVTEPQFNVIAEVKISDRLEFDGGSDSLRDLSKDTLRAVAKVLTTRKDVGRLTIEGHTCSDGPEQWNMQLSRERAAVVRDFLIGECGVARDRLNLVGHGPKMPITTKYVERRTNRRVEFLVL